MDSLHLQHENRLIVVGGGAEFVQLAKDGGVETVGADDIAYDRLALAS